MNNSYNFTKKLLDNIVLPEKGKRLVIHDIAQPELALRVTDKGKKTFLVIKKHKGESIKITIGHYPIMTISQARKQTLVELATLAKGINPNEEKKKLREETTLEEGSRLASFFLLPEEGSHKSSKIFLSMVEFTLGFF